MTTYWLWVWDEETQTAHHTNTGTIAEMAQLIPLDASEVAWAIEEHGQCDAEMAGHNVTITEAGTEPNYVIA